MARVMHCILLQGTTQAIISTDGSITFAIFIYDQTKRAQNMVLSASSKTQLSGF